MQGSLQRVVLRITLGGTICCAVIFSAAGTAFPGEFRVAPIKLEFDKGAKSGVITVINEGRERMNLQVAVSEWTQDAEGKDAYTETSDIVFYPKIMTIEAGDQHIIRAGVKGPLPLREKTYRLFIEEIPEPKKAEGAKVTIAIRFAPPIFVKPPAETGSGSIEKIDLSNGRLTAVVKNTGNVHVTVTSVTMRGAASDGREVFSREIAGWYLLNGVSRTYATEIPPDVCRTMSRIEIDVKTDKFNLNGKLNVHKEMCSP